MAKHFTEKQVRTVIDWFAEHRGIAQGITLDEGAEKFFAASQLSGVKSPGDRAWRLIQKVRWYTDQMDLPIHAGYSTTRETYVYYMPADEYEHDLGQLARLKQIEPRLEHLQMDEERAGRIFKGREAISYAGALSTVSRVREATKRVVGAVARAMGVAS